jgi:hypothetical protein
MFMWHVYKFNTLNWFWIFVIFVVPLLIYQSNIWINFKELNSQGITNFLQRCKCWRWLTFLDFVFFHVSLNWVWPNILDGSEIGKPCSFFNSPSLGGYASLTKFATLIITFFIITQHINCKKKTCDMFVENYYL